LLALIPDMEKNRIIKIAITFLLILLSSTGNAQCHEEGFFMEGSTLVFEIPYNPGNSSIGWNVTSGATIVPSSTGKTADATFPRAGLYTVSVFYYQNGTEKSECWNVWIKSKLLGGTISSNNATVQVAEVFEYSRITNQVMPSGGVGLDRGYTYDYQWEESADGVIWNNIQGAIGLDCTGSNFSARKLYFRRKVSDNIETVYSNVVSADVVNALNAGSIDASQLIGKGAVPQAFSGTAASGATGIFTYQWELSTNGVNWTNITGATGLNYQSVTLNKDTYFRRKCTSGDKTGYSNIILVNTSDASVINIPVSDAISSNGDKVFIRDYSTLTDSDFNIITNHTILKPGVTTQLQIDGLTNQRDFQKTTAYLDGLGRPVESIAVNASLSNKDLVGVSVYDQYGGQPIQHLSYLAATDNNNKGKFRTDVAIKQPEFYNLLSGNQEDFFYGKTIEEESPISRFSQSLAPGKAFVGNNAGAISSARCNFLKDNVRIWSVGDGDNDKPLSTGIYTTGLLQVKVLADENNLKTNEYYDKQGKLIMRSSQLDADKESGELRTYYVYNSLGDLRYVIAPLAVKYCASNNIWDFSTTVASKVLGELCFKNIYDDKRRIVSRFNPGVTEPDYIIYDNRNRQIFFQSALLRLRNEWILNFYDGLDRLVMVASYRNPAATRNSLQSLLDQASLGNGTVTVTNPAEVNLYVDTRDTRMVYEATETIVFSDGFETRLNDEMDAVINPNATGGVESISVNNPLPGITGYNPLSIYYYDRYQWKGAKSFDGSYYLNAGTNPYAETIQLSANTHGKLTGSKIKVSGKNQWLSSTYFFDEKGRIVQGQRDNITGGNDVVTLQYDFNSKILSYYEVIKNPQSITSPAIRIQTRYNYDVNGSVTDINQSIFNNGTSNNKLIGAYTYDEMGRLKTRQLSSLETLTYSYTIDGRIKGINSSYAQNKAAGNYFGMELFYENGFTKRNLAGNFSGITWRRKGDPDEWHAYGYTYDNAGRLIRADYSQNLSGSWGNGTADYTSAIQQYDENGNIKKLKQQGMLAGNVKTTIDELTYINDNTEYSNRLTGVTDIQGDKHLGDFKNYIGRVTTDDYSYDQAGNLIKDKNKGITLTNNYLTGKPQKINIDASGDKYIEYISDVSGSTLQKIVKDGSSLTTYSYINGAVFKNNDLLYIKHPEGRIRRTANGGMEYDYFISDHLGNIRTVITDETSQLYYKATHEDNPQPVPSVPEKEAFSFPKYVDIIPAGHKFYDYNGNVNRKFTKLNSSDPDRKIGTGKVLRVMAGDLVEVGALSYYQQNSPANNTPNELPSDIVNQLVNALLGPASVVANGKGNLLQSNSSGLILNKEDFKNFVNNTQSGNPPSSIPRAYLNYVLFDDNFKMVNGSAVRVQAPDAISPLTGQVNVSKNGFLYIYLSNESPTDVFFDDLVVRHTTGHLLQEDSYYPFGLQMRGLSSRALNRLQNNKLFNGIEKIDEFDLELYDAFYRTLDPQIGRWWQQDPERRQYDNLSPYNVNVNNPVNFSDPLGNSITDWFQRFGAVIWKDSEAASEVINGQVFKNIGKNMAYTSGGVTYMYFGQQLVSINGQNIINSGQKFTEYLSGFSTSALQDLTKAIYQQKVMAESSNDKGMTGNGVLNDERKEALRVETNREALSTIKSVWAAEMSGTDPGTFLYSINPIARANFMSARALAATTNDEAFELISAVSFDISSLMMLRMGMSLNTNRASLSLQYYKVPPPEIYIPKTPLLQQKIMGQDIPLPNPAAGGYPHTTLGRKVGGDNVIYRQSATFTGGTWPLAEGKTVPWSRTDWSTHGRPWDHPYPHQHIFIFDNALGGWKSGGAVPFP
jgi:RHS repeat-associated protein